MYLISHLLMIYSYSRGFIFNFSYPFHWNTFSHLYLWIVLRFFSLMIVYIIDCGSKPSPPLSLGDFFLQILLYSVLVTHLMQQVHNIPEINFTGKVFHRIFFSPEIRSNTLYTLKGYDHFSLLLFSSDIWCTWPKDTAVRGCYGKCLKSPFDCYWLEPSFCFFRF